MRIVRAIRVRLAEQRRAWRVRRWATGTRRRLARAGCDAEIVAGAGVTFDTPPLITITRQVEAGSARGRVRIELGDRVHLGRDMTIEVLPSADSVLALGDGVVCLANVRFVVFGGELRIGPWGKLRDNVAIKSSGKLVVGSHATIQSQTMLHCSERVEIGDHIGIAERVSVFDSDHGADGSAVPWHTQPLITEPVEIGDNVWFGANIVVLRGARIGANCIVAAGSVVRGGDYPESWLIAGVPAEPKRALPGAPTQVR